MLAITFLAPSGVDHWCAPPPAFANWSPEQWKLYAIPTEEVDGVSGSDGSTRVAERLQIEGGRAIQGSGRAAR